MTQCFVSFDVPLTGPSTTTETETVAKYEIMDGAPVKGKLDLNVSKTLPFHEQIFIMDSNVQLFLIQNL